MEFPSPATDYVEKRLSLDDLCNTLRRQFIFLRRPVRWSAPVYHPG